MQTVFSNIYKNNVWRGLNGSGPGSTPDSTVQYCQKLDELVHSLQIGTIVDCGNGFFDSFMLKRPFKYPGVKSYTGVDIVPRVVQRNLKTNTNHLRYKVTFLCADMLTDDLPCADLYVLKDVLTHLPNALIGVLIDRLLTRCKFLFVYNDTKRRHGPQPDIQTGDFRPTDHHVFPIKRFGFADLGNIVISDGAHHEYAKCALLFKGQL